MSFYFSQKYSRMKSVVKKHIACFTCIAAVFLIGYLPQAMASSTAAEGQKFPSRQDKIPKPDHVVIVIEENKAYKSIIGNMAAPYINSLANEGTLFTNSFAVSHPSQPNYLALFSGSTFDVTDDRCEITVSGDNLANEIRKNGLTFGIYSESMPTTGYEGCATPGFRYARKHNPAVNWQGKNILAEINMPFDKFPSDYTRLPTVSMVVPNQSDDMHDGVTLSDQIAQGDRWLKTNLDAYVRWAKVHNSLLIVTWDEDDGSDYNHIATIFVGPMVRHGKYKNRIDHYSVLRTVTDMYGLTPPGNSADAKPIVEVWSSTGTDADNLNLSQ